MELMKEVVLDLYRFAVHALFGTGHTREYIADEIVYVSPRAERMVLLAELPVPLEEKVVTPLPRAHLESVFEPVIATAQKSTVVYCASAGALLRTTPHVGVDNVIDTISFGSMLVAVETNGDWVHVFHTGTEGYVALHDLADRAAYVHPQFVVGERNLAHGPNTERVRDSIEDEFTYSDGELPLQAEEYVAYKLRRQGIRIAWTHVRPRAPGRWNDITRDIPGSERSAEPRPRGVMEWQNGEHGHLAFVEAVFPDGVVQISEANWPHDGIYNERVLVQEEWQQLNPTFIYFG